LGGGGIGSPGLQAKQTQKKGLIILLKQYKRRHDRPAARHTTLQLDADWLRTGSRLSSTRSCRSDSSLDGTKCKYT